MKKSASFSFTGNLKTRQTPALAKSWSQRNKNRKVKNSNKLTVKKHPFYKMLYHFGCETKTG